MASAACQRYRHPPRPDKRRAQPTACGDRWWLGGDRRAEADGAGRDRRLGEGPAAGYGGTGTDRWIGMWSAQALFAIGVSSAVTMIIGFAVMGNTTKPLEDPYLAIMEA